MVYPVNQDPTSKSHENPDQPDDSGTEHVEIRGSQDFFERHIDSRENTEVVSQPLDRKSKSEIDQRSKRLRYIAGGTLATTIVLGVSGYYGGKAILKDKLDEALTPPAATGPVVPGETVTAELSQDKEIGRGEDYLEMKRDTSKKALEAKGFTLNPEYGEDASNQGLADGFTVDLYSAWELGTTNKPEADKVLRAIIDPANKDDFQRYADMIGGGGTAILANVSEVPDATNNFKKSNFRGADGEQLVESNGLDMRALTVIFSEDPDPTVPGIINQIVYQRKNLVTPDGEKKQKWVIESMVPSSSPSYIENLGLLNDQLS